MATGRKKAAQRQKEEASTVFGHKAGNDYLCTCCGTLPYSNLLVCGVDAAMHLHHFFYTSEPVVMYNEKVWSLKRQGKKDRAKKPYAVESCLLVAYWRNKKPCKSATYRALK